MLMYLLKQYGKIGIKVWICKGEVLTKRDLNPNILAGGEGKSVEGGARGFENRGDRGGDRRDDRRPGGGGGRSGGNGGGGNRGGAGGGRR